MASTVTLDSLSFQIDPSDPIIMFPDVLSIESLSFQIDTSDPIMFPDVLSIESLSIQRQALEFVEIYSISQHESYKFFLMKETGTNVYSGCNSININPDNIPTIQTILDTYSGTIGKVTFTAQELYNLSTSNKIVLYYAESILNDIPVNEYKTKLAYILIKGNYGKVFYIRTYQLIQ